VQRSMTGQFSSTRSFPKRGNPDPLAGTPARAAREAAKIGAQGVGARWGKYLLRVEPKVRFSRYAVHGSRLCQHSGHSKSIKTGGSAGACCHIADMCVRPGSSRWHCVSKDVYSVRILRPLQRWLLIHGLSKATKPWTPPPRRTGSGGRCSMTPGSRG
jgi:hypothetical protein